MVICPVNTTNSQNPQGICPTRTFSEGKMRNRMTPKSNDTTKQHNLSKTRRASALYIRQKPVISNYYLHDSVNVFAP